MDKKVLEYAQNRQSDSEEEDYDYGQEIAEVYLKRRTQNTYFQEIDFKKDPKHALIYTNDELMKKQRGVLTHVIKQLGSNIMQGKSLLHVSLPIKVFEANSFLEKCALFMKTAPFFCEKAAEIPQNTP